MKRLMSLWLAALIMTVQPAQAVVMVGFGQSTASGPVEIASDSFSSYSHATPLGNTSSWDAVLSSMLTLSTDTVRGNAVSALSACNWVTDSFNANQYATTTAGAVNTGTVYGGPAVRASLSGGTVPKFYALIGNGGNTIKLYSYNGDDTGSETNEIASYSQAYSAGGKLKLEVTGTGASIRLAAYYDADGSSGWTTLATNVDPVDEFDSGAAGIAYWGNSDPARITAWSGGNL